MNNNNLGNFLNALGVALALVNIGLNDEQIDQLNTHLQQQDESFLKKIIDQNEILIAQNNEMLFLLKENKEILFRIKEGKDIIE